MDESPRLVAFVDDDEDMRAANRQSLELAGYEPRVFSDARAALAAIDMDFPGVVVTDLRMPGMDGLQLFAVLRERDPALPVMLITGHADVATAVAATRDGAYDFITKPYPADVLIRAVGRALDQRGVTLENRRLRMLAERAAASSALIGVSPVIEQLRRTIDQIAKTDVDILIEGETGTGKTLVASLIHRASNRGRRPIVTMDCGALPEYMIESELFGHVPDAFPGARHTRTGRIEAAEFGTLLLDQVDLMPLAAQPKLLRACEDRVIMPLGANEPRAVDFRLIAASRRPLVERVAEGELLDTLLYRLNGVVLHLPPLRRRRDDIPILFSHFIDAAAQRHKRPTPPFTNAVWQRLLTGDWPGNARELSHYAERIVLGLTEGHGQAPDPNGAGLAERVEAFEAAQIRRTLAATGGSVAKAVVQLKLPRKTFYDKARKHNIRPQDWRR